MCEESCSTSDFLYEAIEVSVASAGCYSLMSSSNDSDMYGYLYDGQFDPFNTTKHLIAKDDSGNDRNGRFNLALQLRPGIKYILIATAAQPKKEVAFSVYVSGPANITFLKPMSECVTRM